MQVFCVSGALLELDGCVQQAPPPAELVQAPLLDDEPWRAYPASEDPLPTHQPSQIDCGAGGFYVERQQLEIDTSYCNYLLAEHPSRLSIAANTEVSIELSHYDLTAPEPTTAHAALLFGDDVVWETFIDIPAAADVLHATVRSPHALAAGQPVRLHLHNHGQNNYALGPILVMVPKS